jgi:hypothetical protein
MHTLASRTPSCEGHRLDRTCSAWPATMARPLFNSFSHRSLPGSGRSHAHASPPFTCFTWHCSFPAPSRRTDITSEPENLPIVRSSADLELVCVAFFWSEDPGVKGEKEGGKERVRQVQPSSARSVTVHVQMACAREGHSVDTLIWLPLVSLSSLAGMA